MIKKKVILTILAILFIIFIYIQNNMIEIRTIPLEFSSLPKNFNGYKIVHLSDLQGKTFGKNNSTLLSKIKKEKPDIIVITGDLIDAGKSNEESIIKFLDELKQLAPVYYVTGNHELASKNFLSLENRIKEKNIVTLRNISIPIEKNADVINVIGIDDPICTEISENPYNKNVLDTELEKALSKPSSPSIDHQKNFTILLSHRPEQFSLYTSYNIDLIFAGHAHGGQIRLPFIGGLLSPNQGFLPKYTRGKYSEKNSTMIVSRGLGNGTIPIRLFNRPEIVVVTLWKK